MKKSIAIVASIVLVIAGAVIAYLSIFHDAFGGASGFLAVVGVVIVAVPVCALLGISGSDIEKHNNTHIDRMEIERLNNEWNNAQRKYDRYNPKRK